MEIGEFSDKTGITIDTLRYYDKIGLIVPNRKNNRRSYNIDDIEKAGAVVKLKNLDFTLDEIKSLFDLDKNIDETKRLNENDIDNVKKCLDVIEQKYECIIKKEKDLVQMKNTLKNMIDKTNILIKTRSFYCKDIKKINNEED